MNGSEYFLEDDEFFEDDGEADLDEFFEDEPEDDPSERARGRGRKLPRVRPGKTGTGKGYTRGRPGGGKFATRVELQAGLARVGKDIRQNSEAIKKVTAQINKTNSQLAAASSRQDKEIANLRKEMKKQSETSLLLTLLTPQPKLVATDTKAAVATAEDVVKNITFSAPDLLLPLALSGGFGGSTGGDSNSLGASLPLLLIATGAIGK